MSFIDLNYEVYTQSPFLYHHLQNDDVLGSPSSPKQRHDGTSPLPLGMDWSLPPRNWDGRNSVWPHDPHTGWSFCVTVPSWVDVPQSSDSDPVVFYRVQVGIQSPQGITTSRVILRRFNDFLNLFSDLQKEFPMKNLPPAPPKKIFRIKSHALLEERRILLSDWMENLLSDIDVSRSAPAAIFLELEAAARSAFHDMNQHISDETSTFPDNSRGSVKDRSKKNATAHDLIHSTEETLDRDYRSSDHVKRSSIKSTGGDLSSLSNSETSNSASNTSFQDDSYDLPLSNEPSRSSDLLVTSPSDERLKSNRILNTQQQGLTTAETNVEDLIARLNQEMVTRQYLMTKVKDLEIELETTRANLKSEEDERLLAESTKTSLIQEKQMLQQDLDVAREQIKHLMKNHDDFVTKSKTDTKLLITEVNSLRSSQLELQQQLSELMKEKQDVEAQLLAEDVENADVAVEETLI